MKKLFIIFFLILSILPLSLFAFPPMPPAPSLPLTCSNGEVAVWNSTTAKWDTCAGLAGGGDMLAATYVTAGKINPSTGGTGIDSSGSTGFAYDTAGTWSIINAATLRTNAGLVIGTDVQAYDADLAYLAGFTPSANVKTLLNAANNAAIKTALGYYTSGDAMTGSISGNAGTATALAANGGNCSAGSYPLGVDASGAAESCTAAPVAADFHVDDLITLSGAAQGATTFGTFTGTTLSDNKNTKELLQEIETAFEALPGGHTQNTDTGTSSATFMVGTGGPKLKNNSDTLEARTNADAAYAPFKALTINGTTITATTGFSGNLTGAVTGNADTATLASTVTVVDSTDTSSYIAMVDSATGSLAVKTDAGLTYNAQTGVLTATGFAGPLTGTASNASQLLTKTWAAPDAIGTGTPAAATFTALTATGTTTLATALTGVLRADSGVVSVDADVTDIVAGASTSAAGKIEIATNAETTTGSSTSLAVTPDDLAYLFARPFAIGSTTPGAATFTTISGGAGGFTVDADGDVVGKTFTVTKVNNVPGQSLLYSSHLTDTTGAGWQGPSSAAGMANSYYLALPEAEPTNGQVLIAGTPSSHISAMTWGTALAGVTASRGLVLTGSSVGLIETCNATEILKWSGSAWACAADASAGAPALDDVTNPDAAKTFTLLDNNASALSFGSTGKADILKIITTDAGEGVTMSGTLGVSGATTLGGTLAMGANNITSTGSLGATGAGKLTKGWFVNLESTNMPTVNGTALLTSLTAPQFTTIEVGHASDSTLARVSAGILSVEGKTLPRIIASGATALDFASTATGACATVIQAAATGVASTDVIQFNANASIKAVTGYVPAATGGFSISVFPTSDYVNFEACNWTAGTVDPASITVNWVVVR